MRDAIMKLDRGNPETRALVAAIDRLNVDALHDLVSLVRMDGEGDSVRKYERRLNQWRSDVWRAIDEGLRHMQALINDLYGLKLEEALMNDLCGLKLDLSSTESKTARPSDPPKPDPAG